ncbi:MAG: cyclic nucleotide-binding domain-containing protein [Leptospiraceae bacterium]|nr:cyclic nucleotide-binding domain-containing protein [Leptospiraceae bacterium]
MAVVDIIPGVKIYQGKDFSVLFGCPPEIIKHLMIRQIPFPDLIVIPDTIHKNGTLQNSTEFPLYYFLFLMGNFQKGVRLNIAGNKTQVKNNRKLLQLSLLGPSVKEFNAIGASKYYRRLYNESRYIAIKDKEGKEITIDGFVNFSFFKQDLLEVELNDRPCKIQHLERNVYEIEGERIDINFTERQPLAYDLKSSYTPTIPFRFGVDVLGGGSGFTPNKPCSALLLNYNSDYMLIDCPPYLEDTLNARGISCQQIKSIYMSHIHDDHCNMFPLLQFNNKIQFLGTREIYWMALQKLSLQTELNIEDLYSFFDFVDLEPYQENDFYGMQIIPHYTVHSIPTAGATFQMKSGGRQHRIVFVGDNKSLDDIKQMRDEGIVSAEKYDHILSLYHQPYDIIFPDGGMGILHGNPRDSIESDSSKVVFMHLENLPSEFDATFSMARAGKRYAVIDDQYHSIQALLVKAMLILQNHFHGISDRWAAALMNEIRIEHYNSGDVIMKQGEENKGLIFIILTGKCSVMFHDGESLKEVAVKEAGDIVGEMAAVNQQKERSASIVAHTPVTLCAIDERTWYSFLVAENRIGQMQSMWKNRSEMEKNAPFSRFSDFVNDKMARLGRRREVNAGEIIIRQGSQDNQFYIILQGSFMVEHGSMKVKQLEPGDLFGEHASLTQRIRNSTIKAITDGIILELQRKDIEHIVSTTPVLNHYILELMRDRDRELARL